MGERALSQEQNDLELLQPLDYFHYSESMAMKQQKKVIGRARVQKALTAAMDDSGIDTALLARTILEGLKAVRVVTSGGTTIEVPDHNVRHKFLQTALELRGDYPDKTIHQVEETYEERILRLHAELDEEE